MTKVKDIRNFFNSRKEADTPALVASATDDVSQSKLLIVENEIRKSTQIKKLHHQCPRKDQNRGWNICSDSLNQNYTRTFQLNLSKIYFS